MCTCGGPANGGVQLVPPLVGVDAFDTFAIGAAVIGAVDCCMIGVGGLL